MEHNWDSMSPFPSSSINKRKQEIKVLTVFGQRILDLQNCDSGAASVAEDVQNMLVRQANGGDAVYLMDAVTGREEVSGESVQ